MIAGDPSARAPNEGGPEAQSGPTGFVAYSSAPLLISATIEQAVAEVEQRLGRRKFDTWRDNDIAGRFVDQQVRDGIDKHDLLIADISVLNLNVAYEIGYGIGKRKRVVVIRNPAITQSVNLSEVGIFDTLGWVPYQNSDDLVDLISQQTDATPLTPDGHGPNWSKPVYMLESRHKTEWERLIHARLKRARLSVRVFDPLEDIRLSSHFAFRDVSVSLGVIIPLLPSSIEDSFIHNLRGSFVAGLADGMEKHLLLMQEGADPLPLDYRDYVRSYRHPGEIADFIAEFATEVYAELQNQRGGICSSPPV